ncbi:hypothetical protein [Glycomyces niveus]|uniref:Uncharacterized protein n=1 Tax=Glycomyces niveus TaxID=2820287 RepID=A0ABS3U1Y0_9ACTN|nr:hypothetical protein [Glycomyces sp. NEAU-S30]MBO3732769.1 hypothetical protein [Glycomyces sp. NEAU-S30]
MSHPIATVIVAIVIVAAWIGAVFYSRHRYPLETCAACRGSGKDFEPVWLSWARLSRTRRFRPCPVCGGAAKFNIHGN